MVMKTDMTVANTILAQLGGAAKLTAMLGAKHFMGDEKSLTFKFGAKAKNGANCCVITLDPSDTYTVRFCKVAKFDVVEKGETSMVYADSLRRHFESETGLRLSL